MTASDDKYPTIASRSTIQYYKHKYIGAKKGHTIMKRKSDALKFKLSEYSKDIEKNYNEIIRSYKQALFFKTEAEHVHGDVSSRILSSASKHGSVEVLSTPINVMGIIAEKFSIKYDKDAESGLWSSGKVRIKKTRKAFQLFLEAMTVYNSSKMIWERINEESIKTNQKVNALEFVILPKLENTIKYIESELDEREREENFRMKKVVMNKKKNESKNK
eukprot:GAHX01000775.1.p1 GENE.GAHX01000775.1~~GAHX01000775.1.p1  ORF type:complete len:218 (-),score=48.65 GAHX01000775.1:92-745(-)